MSDKKIIKTKRYIYTIICIIFLFLVFYFATFEEINYSFEEVTYESNGCITDSLVDGTVVKEKININSAYIRRIQIQVGTYMRINEGQIELSLYDGDKLICSRIYNANKIEDNSYIQLDVFKWVDDTPVLFVTSKGAREDNSITLYYSDQQGDCFSYNNELMKGTLSKKMEVGYPTVASRWYKAAMIIMVMLCIVICLKVWHDEKYNKRNGILFFCQQINKYFFLIKQLVQRDYKAKYMRSVLGLVWSLLYPVLMMAVQYVVFSTLFRTNIKYYPVYLLCANAMFTFFSNAVSSGLTSIVNNASLITKVYVPKYLYPLTKVLSTSIDLFLAMIPLTIVVLLTGAPITKAWLLIPMVFLLLMLFSAGMSFLMATLNVFFRDTQFLWGLATTVWMYATPLFYPENAIPEKYRFIFNLNPMYHYISFFRRILLYGCSPTIYEILICICISAGVYYFGMNVFKKHEGSFILYI